MQGRTATAVCLVIPCYDESARLATAELARLADEPDLSLVLVDDGSTDDTAAVLQAFATDRPTVDVVSLRTNGGKGEAVRAGLRRAFEPVAGAPFEIVGYLDADLSTPVDEVVRLVDIMRSRPDVEVLLGARVALLGRDIRRSAVRHYTGRVFATAASGVLHKAVYDTQCGAKVLRRTPRLEQAIAAPFRSRWAFDVELLGRLDRLGVPAHAFLEEPLQSWQDAAGSRRSLGASVRSTWDLVGVARDLRSWGSR